MRRVVVIGGGEWTADCVVEAELLEQLDASRVLLVAAASASFGPARAIERATARFGSVGIEAVDSGLLRRSDATADDVIGVLDTVDAVYLGGGSSQYLVSAMRATPWWDRLVSQVDGGLLCVAAGAAAAACCSVMLDERGGGFGVGLGLVDSITVVPESDQLSPDRVRRVRELTPAGVPVAWVPQYSAVLLAGSAVVAHGDVEWTLDGVTTSAPTDLSSR